MENQGHAQHSPFLSLDDWDVAYHGNGGSFNAKRLGQPYILHIVI